MKSQNIILIQYEEDNRNDHHQHLGKQCKATQHVDDIHTYMFVHTKGDAYKFNFAKICKNSEERKKKQTDDLKTPIIKISFSLFIILWVWLKGSFIYFSIFLIFFRGNLRNCRLRSDRTNGQHQPNIQLYDVF